MKRWITILLIFISLASNSNAQLSLSVYGAASIPNGSFSDYYKTALGFRGNIFYATNDALQLFLQSGYNVWKFNNEKFNDWSHNSGVTGNYELEIPITAIPLLAGARYSREYNAKTKIYVEVAAGVYFIKSDASGKFSDNTGVYDLGSESKKYTEFTFHIGGGVTLMLNKNLSLDTGIFMDFITDSEAAKQAKPKTAKEYYDGKQVRTLVLCLGLNYRF